MTLRLAAVPFDDAIAPQDDDLRARCPVPPVAAAMRFPGAALRRRREAAGFTIEAVEADLGWPHGLLARFEAGVAVPGDGALEDLGRVFTQGLGVWP